MNELVIAAFEDELEKVARVGFLARPSAGGVLRAVGRGGAIGGLGMLGLGALASRDPAMMAEMGAPSSGASTSGPDWERVEVAKAKAARSAGWTSYAEGRAAAREATRADITAGLKLHPYGAIGARRRDGGRWGNSR
jgi:hypothetical protein